MRRSRSDSSDSPKRQQESDTEKYGNQQKGKETEAAAVNNGAQQNIVLRCIMVLFHLCLASIGFALWKLQFYGEEQIKSAFQSITKTLNFAYMTNVESTDNQQTQKKLEQQAMVEQQTVFQTCTITFDRLLLGFATYHFIYTILHVSIMAFGNTEQPPKQEKKNKKGSKKSRQLADDGQKQSSCGDQLCSLQGFMSLIGLCLSSWAMIEFMKDNQKCFNYANLSIVWILVEIVTFFLGIIMGIVYFWMFKSTVEPIDSQKKAKKMKQAQRYRRSNDVRFSQDTINSDLSINNRSRHEDEESYNRQQPVIESNVPPKKQRTSARRQRNSDLKSQ